MIRYFGAPESGDVGLNGGAVVLLFKLIIPHRIHLIKFLRGAPGIAAGKSGDAPGQEEPELLSAALPIEIFEDSGACELSFETKLPPSDRLST